MDPSTRQARDAWIALRCQSGEAGAFAELVREMERPLLYYAGKLLGDDAAALDALQDVWATAFGSIRKLKDPALLRAWLYRLTHGVAIDRIRRDQTRRRA